MPDNIQKGGLQKIMIRFQSATNQAVDSIPAS